MAGRLERGGRVAAAALLALGSMAPLNGPLLAAGSVVPVADTSAACAVTVGTATTDPALAADAARAIAVGYTATDCLPDATLLAAAEARAAIPMAPTTTASTTTATTPTAVGSPLGGTRSSGSVVAAPITTTTAPTTAGTPTPTGTTTDTTTSETTTEPTSSDATTDETSSDPDDDGSSSDRSSSRNDDDSDSGNPATADGPVADGSAADGTTTAAGKLGWGTAGGVEDFDADLADWGVYDGDGHAGNGRRSPSAMSVNSGILTITGDASGTTGGMAWRLGRAKYGRWEARIKSPVADPSYNAVMLLWPDAENWPVGGEVDFMEIGDETRQKTDFFLHYGEENHQLHGQVAIDATQWHNWAVEWSPTKITAYVDGTEWYSTTQASALPPGSMHLTLQLDWFPKGGSVQQSAMHVDWVRYYPIDGTGASEAVTNSVDNTSDTGVTLNRSAATGTTGDGTDAGGTDESGTDGSSVAGATSTTTVTITPEDDATTTTDRSEPTAADGNSARGDGVGTAGADAGAAVTVTTNAVEENGGDTTPSSSDAAE